MEKRQNIMEWKETSQEKFPDKIPQRAFNHLSCLAIAVLMEGGDSLLDAIYEEDNLESIDDVEMLDVEEGELVEPNLHIEKGKSSGGDVNLEIQGSQSKNRGLGARKKKNRRKKGGSRPVTDINRFVLDTCRRLKERKSYMVYTAVGCLGVSALNDLVKEISLAEAILLISVMCSELWMQFRLVEVR
ncbi:hypothetical protein CMV_001829 [Castanea mollissima]|uniref:Uncharacterized protein n=1 Tax=Castanea mollissima TaxID=60419 RepID=A0A8J4RYI7_9ROSI|nr:hypothetical protein CMV_001829 [Castanea mollissima]